MTKVRSGEMLSKSEIQKVKKLYQIGVGIEKIADIFKVTENTIYQLCKKNKKDRVTS